MATPALLRFLEHGADIVVHSLTKSMTSSGFGIAGAVIGWKPIVTNIPNDAMREDFASYIKFLPNRDNGPSVSPIQAVLTLNDLGTLRSRMDLLWENTQRLASFLASHPKVESLNYLGLEDHPLHQLARRYLKLADCEQDSRYRREVMT